MTIIIDGYNVLKPLARSSDVCDRKRTHFIDQVTAYAQSSKNSVTIVFDGGDYTFPVRYKQNGLMVMYSGYKDSADDVIKKLITKMRADDTVVVSTDRDICAYADRLNIATIDSHIFYGYMRDANQEELVSGQSKKTGDLHKRKGHESDSEIDALMEEASSMMILQSDDHEYTDKEQQKLKTSNKKKLSKAERQLQKIVKKL